MLIKLGEDYRIPARHWVHRPGAWLPEDRRIHRRWLARVCQHVDENPRELLPVLQEFKDLIESTPRIYMYFTRMWTEIPNSSRYSHDPTGGQQIRDYEQMLDVLNHILRRGPGWADAAESVGLVGVPMCAIFDYAMGTASGHAAFLDLEVNKMLKKVLQHWGKFLETPASLHVLGNGNEDWFGKTGMANLMTTANKPNETHYKFEEFYICDPLKDNYGYKSWDDFFTRKFREEVRPVASPCDDRVIANPCESAVYNIQHDVKLRDTFFAKGQPYSLTHMMANDPLAPLFVGGTIYQAFLSALSYHRWHSPVSGRVRRAFVEDGTYFSEPLIESHSTIEVPLNDALASAQSYLACLATRAVIVIEPDNPDIGLLTFIAIGMDEVSTCDITVKEGQYVTKGQETGMFHYGGSSFVLIFQKGVDLEGLPRVGRKTNVPVRSKLAVVRS